MDLSMIYLFEHFIGTIQLLQITGAGTFVFYHQRLCVCPSVPLYLGLIPRICQRLPFVLTPTKNVFFLMGPLLVAIDSHQHRGAHPLDRRIHAVRSG